MDVLSEGRQEEIEEKLVDSKPLEDMLAEMLKHSPTLSTLLLKGIKLPNPFKPSNKKTP